MTLSEQIVYAMFKPSRYKEMIKLKRKKSVLFIVVLMFVLGIVTFAVPTGAYITGFGGFEKLFTQNMGNIKYQDGALSIDKPFEMIVGGAHILIDTETETVTDEKMNKSGAYFAIGSKNMRLAIVSDRKVSDYKTISLTGLLPDGLDNNMLVSYIPGIYMYLVIIFISTCIGFFIKYGFFALVFSICINSMNKRMELGLTYGQVFMLCFYGQTLGMILVNFNAAIGLMPAIIVSLVGFFISINMITMSVAIIHQGKQV
ncbi:MAG: DUF1189 domain-containing protein [Lachnospiraceae bacterium]|nr:DUF1189 domain-containing protein [Lachnospiraceae bacterium]